MIIRLLSLTYLFLVAGIMVAYAGDAWVADPSWHEEHEHRVYNDSLDEVVSDIHRRREGRILSADTVEEDGHSVHRIRILSEKGLVRGLRFDGATGRPLPRYNESHSLRTNRSYGEQRYHEYLNQDR